MISRFEFYRDDGTAVCHEVDRQRDTSIMRAAETMDEARELVEELKWASLEKRRDLVAGLAKLDRELGRLCDALRLL